MSIKRAKRLKDLRRMAALEAEPVPDLATPELMRRLLANSVGYMVWARNLVGEMKPEQFWLQDPRTGEKFACAEFELEQRMLTVVKTLVESIERHKLDERGVRVEEAKMAVLGAALARAAEEAGLTEEQRRDLGASLRRQLQLVEETDGG